MEPLVSIIVPCYRHERYVEDCISSLIAQTYRNIEVIICDDCSPDASYELLIKHESELRHRFDRVEILKNDVNQGVVKNLNRMLGLVNGKYIKGIASDDMLIPDCIENLVKYYEGEGRDCDFIFSNGYKIPENSSFGCIGSQKLIYDATPESGEELTGKICADNYIAAPTVMIKRDTFGKYGLYDETLPFEDYEFWLRVAKDGKIGYLDKPTVLYRNSDSSLSRYDGSEAAVKRFREANTFRMQVYRKYEKYCSNDDKARFCNSTLDMAMDAGDGETVKQAINEAKTNSFRISSYSRIKYFLFRIGLYTLIRNFLVR